MPTAGGDNAEHQAAQLILYGVDSVDRRTRALSARIRTAYRNLLPWPRTQDGGRLTPIDDPGTLQASKQRERNADGPEATRVVETADLQICPDPDPSKQCHWRPRAFPALGKQRTGERTATSRIGRAAAVPVRASRSKHPTVTPALPRPRRVTPRGPRGVRYVIVFA